MVLLVVVSYRVDNYWFVFNLQSIAQRRLPFSDTIQLNVTDRNGTEIASAKVILYRCRSATTYVHVRQNVFGLID